MAARKTTARKTVKTAETTGAANDAFASAETFSTAAREQYETFVSAFADNAETLRSETEGLVATLRDNFESVQSRLQSVNADLAIAARTEAAEAVEFVNELARAKSVADALEIQRGYWTKLFETRIERARELTEATVETARSSFEPFGKSFQTFGNVAAFEKFLPFGAK